MAIFFFSAYSLSSTRRRWRANKLYTPVKTEWNTASIKRLWIPIFVFLLLLLLVLSFAWSLLLFRSFMSDLRQLGKLPQWQAAVNQASTSSETKQIEATTKYITGISSSATRFPSFSFSETFCVATSLFCKIKQAQNEAWNISSVFPFFEIELRNRSLCPCVIISRLFWVLLFAYLPEFLFDKLIILLTN